jgi:hypothetical protein
MDKHAVVRVHPGADGLIASVSVAGRPTPHPFPGGREGSHLTPWAVFVDTVRRSVVGRSVEDAAEWIRRRSDAIIGEADELRPERKQRLLTAASAAKQAARDAGDAVGEGNNGVPQLQKAIAAYLTARNLAPLSAVYLGPAEALGRGEPAPLSFLRKYEEDRVSSGTVEVSEYLMKLMDRDALKHIEGKTTDDGTVPGIKPEPGVSAADAVVRHLRDISLAYPLAYRNSQLASETGYNRFAQSQGWPPVPSGYQWPVVDDAETAPEDWSLPASGTFLTNVALSDSDPVKITRVEFNGRSRTLLSGASSQGHHVTAHVLIEESVRANLVGATLPTALENLISLAKRLWEFPTYRAAPLNPQVDPKEVYAKALVIFDAALEAAEAVHGPADEDAMETDVEASRDDLVREIESLAGAYVTMRNALPMAALAQGSLATSRGEPEAMEDLRETEKNLAKGIVKWSRSLNMKMCLRMWQLLDWSALQALATPDDDDTDWNDLAPGAPTDRDERVIHALDVHLRTIDEAFPRLAAKTDIRTTGSVIWVFKQANSPLPDMDELISALELETNDDFTPAAPAVVLSTATKQKRKRNESWDDPDDMPYVDPSDRPKKRRK